MIKPLLKTTLLAAAMLTPLSAAQAQLICLTTQTLYQGNLGGISGADTKCQSEYGANFQFARSGSILMNVAGEITIQTGRVWAPGHSTNDCSGWSSTSGNGSVWSTTFNAGNLYWGVGNQACNTDYHLLCCNTDLP